MLRAEGDLSTRSTIAAIHLTVSAPQEGGGAIVGNDSGFTVVPPQEQQPVLA
jgi:hypothetical protein